LCFATINDFLASAGRRKVNLWNTSTGQLLWSVLTPDEAFAFAFSEDDKILYAATKANYTILLDVHVGSEVEKFKFSDWDEDERREHKYRRPPIQGDFSVGLGLLGVAYRGRPVSFWDLDEHEFVGQFHRSQVVYPEPFIHAFIFNPNPEINLASVSYQDGITYAFEPVTQKTQATADTDASVLAASPDGTVLATGSGDGIIKLYDFETMKLLHQIFLHQQAIRAIVFSSSGHRFFEIRGSYCNVWEPPVLVRRQPSGDDSSVDISDRVVPPPDLNNARTYGDERTVISLVPHHENDYVFCGREDGTVAVYATKTGKIVQELFIHSHNVAVDFLEWNPSQSLLASADRSGRCVVRRVSKTTLKPFDVGEPILDENPSSVLNQILMSLDGNRLLMSTSDSNLLWDTTTSTVVHCQKPVESQQTRKWISHPDTNRLLLFTGGSARVYDWKTLEQLSRPGGISLDKSDPTIVNAIFPSQSPNVCLVASKRDASSRYTVSFQLWPVKTFSLETEVSPSATFLNGIAKDFKAVVGTYKSWLVYLQHGGWVCSVNLDTIVKEKFYIRHFFIPLNWHGTAVNPMGVTQKGSIVIAVGDEVVVFHNGLDFEEKVPL
jgi:WD40 repeat protein